MGKKILIINGNPREGSLTDALAAAYAQGARQAGHQVQLMVLRDLQFDPVLWNGYHKIQPLEADLQAAQEWIHWSEHLVWVYPTWWGGPPALLKGFIDRTLLPAFAFKYHDKGPWWNKLLAGRTSRIITTMDSPWLWYRLVYRSAGTALLRNAVLKFCGLKPVRSTHLDRVRFRKPEETRRWIRQIEQLGAKGR
ncbi:MAG: NAD(P)H-dependent oxidoreductase [Bacteroidetes bacterium]|nr:NAD(P)H-dependent oxidoreductase [Bacteroidota bacterium]